MRKNPGRAQRRDAARQAGRPPRGIYGEGLLQPQRTRNKERMHKLHPLRGDNGGYTCVGARQQEPFGSHVAQHSNGTSFRRIWLAGISAQRGY